MWSLHNSILFPHSIRGPDSEDIGIGIISALCYEDEVALFITCLTAVVIHHRLSGPNCLG